MGNRYEVGGHRLDVRLLRSLAGGRAWVYVAVLANGQGGQIVGRPRWTRGRVSLGAA